MIFFQDNGFIGYHPNQSFKFNLSDSQEKFDYSCSVLPNDWYYRTAEITYTYNSLGHRSIEPKDLNLDNYILFAGCSSTEGIGLELEKTYPYLIANELGCDYYNLSVSGVGIDVIAYNLMVWSRYVEKMPKYLVVQWPHQDRFITIDDNNITLNGIFNEDRKIVDFVLAGEDCKFFDSRIALNHKLISSVYNTTKIINVGIKNISEYDGITDVRLVPDDFARDTMHAGIESQKTLANQIVESIR